MSIIYLDMDAFFCSIEQQTRPSLQNKPVVVGGLGLRGIVLSPNYEARSFGVRSAMPMFLARELLPWKTIYIPPRSELYSYTSRCIWQDIQAISSSYEQVSIDEGCLEYDDSSAEQMGNKIQAMIAQKWGLGVSVGIAPAKSYAKIACEDAKPGGVVSISPEKLVGYLAELPIRKIPGIGPVTEYKLQEANIFTIGDITAAGHNKIVKILGDLQGQRLLHLAWGQDTSKPQRHIRKHISNERTFTQDITTRNQLLLELRPLAIHALERLKHKNFYARSVSIYVRNNLAENFTQTKSIFGLQSPEEIIEVIMLNCPDPHCIGAIRLLGIRFQGLHRHKQLSLFSNDLNDLSASQNTAFELDSGRVSERCTETTGKHSTTAMSNIFDSISPKNLAGENNSDIKLSPHLPPHDLNNAILWKIGDDLIHPQFGFGWVQGSNHAKVTVRFESHSAGKGVARTFDIHDPALTPASSTLAWGFPDVQ